MASSAQPPATDETRALAETMDRIDNSLCHLARDDPRFEPFEELAKDIGTAFGHGDGIPWKRHVATDSTGAGDEAKIGYNIARIFATAEQLPSNWRQMILDEMRFIAMMTDLDEVDDTHREEIVEYLIPTISVKVGREINPDGYLVRIRKQLMEGYIDYSEVVVRFSFSAFRCDEEEIREMVEKRVLEEVLSIRQVEQYELIDEYQTAESEASDLLGILEYRMELTA